MKSLRILVYGKVQGVNFRKYTWDFCNQNEIKGQVKNLNDGSVEIYAQGTEAKLDILINWARVGSGRARVDKIAIEEIEGLNFEKFHIAR